MKSSGLTKLWLCVPAILICMLDQSLTLLGQSDTYWAGNYYFANEGNPLFKWLLQKHPIAFEAGIMLWIALFSALIYHTPRRISMILSMSLIMGHTWGSCTWIYNDVSHGYWICIGLFILSAISITHCWDHWLFQNHSGNFEKARLESTTGLVRGVASAYPKRMQDHKESASSTDLIFEPRRDRI